jgi:hypothetical protein
MYTFTHVLPPLMSELAAEIPNYHLQEQCKVLSGFTKIQNSRLFSPILFVKEINHSLNVLMITEPEF